MRLLREFIPALVFLVGSRRQLGRFGPGRLAGAGWRLMLLGAALGLGFVGLWELTYRLSRPHLTHGVVTAQTCAAVACAVAWVALTYRRGFLSLIKIIAGPRRRIQWPGLVGVVAAWAALLSYAVRYWNPDWPTHLPAAAAWLWPRALYRVILLAPVWGSWSMVVLGKFHASTAKTDPYPQALADGTSPVAAAALLALPLAGSFIYLMFLAQPLRFVPPAAAILAALGGGALAIRIRGRLCREALLAANVLTQSAFLLAYLTVR